MEEEQFLFQSSHDIHDIHARHAQDLIGHEAYSEICEIWKIVQGLA